MHALQPVTQHNSALEVHQPEPMPTDLPAGIDKIVAFAVMERPIRTWLEQDQEFLKKEKLIPVFRNAFQKLGHANNSGAMTALIVDDILMNKNLHNLSPSDIDIAITRGLRGDYNVEFVTMNVQVANQLITSYMGQRYEVKRQMRKCLLDEQEKAKKKEELRLKAEYDAMPLEERQNASYEALVAFLDENKKTPLAWNWDCVFGKLESAGEITMTIEEKRVFSEKVKIEIAVKANELTKVGQTNIAKALRLVIESNNGLAVECRKRLVEQWAAKYLQTIAL